MKPSCRDLLIVSFVSFAIIVAWTHALARKPGATLRVEDIVDESLVR